MCKRHFQYLRRRFDPQARVTLWLSSRDPELGRYLRAVGARGSTRLEYNGNICIQIDDANGAPKAVWMEEFAHALQLLRGDVIHLSCEDPHNAEKEAEVARCLLRRAETRTYLAIPDDLIREYREKANWGNRDGDT